MSWHRVLARDLDMTVNVRPKNRSISRTNMVVDEGGMSIRINSPFIRAPRQEPPAQLAEGQDVVASVVAGTRPGMCFSYTPPTNSNLFRSTNRSHPTKHKSGSCRNTQTCIRICASSASNRWEINRVPQELGKINQ